VFFSLLSFYYFTYALPSDSVNHASAVYGSGSNFILNAYQHWISPIKGGNTCPMYPSCSQYAKILFEQEPFPLAIAGTCDRLLRCGRDLDSYQVVNVDGSFKISDPPEIRQQMALLDNADSSSGRSAELDTVAHYTAQPCDIKYANALSGLGLHENAFQEYLRTAMLCNQDSLRRAAFAGTIRSAYYSTTVPEFIDLYNKLLPRLARDTLLTCYFHIAVAQKHLNAGDFRQALWTLRWCIKFSSGNPLRNEYFFLKSIAQLRSFEWNEAAQSVDSIDTASSKSIMRKRIAGLAVTLPALPHRNRYCSAVLSAVLPGAGYVYTKRPTTGMAALMINGLFIWSAVEMFKAHHIALGTSISIVGSGWYLGTIRGSLSAADRFNLMEKNIFVDRLLEGITIESCPVFEH
jgi:putative component of membrane protein insertase Oxa1/YidC/SpoIIIJ protein YidD